MDGLDEAASAFATEIGGKSAPASGGVKETLGVEDVFGTRQLEDDSEAGGDESDDELPGVDDEATDEEREALRAEEGADEDGEEDEEEGEEDSEAGELDLDAVVRVTVDGEPVEVSLNEALNGYIRMETFHRRLNQVNEAKKIVQQEAQKVVSDRQRYAQLVEEAEATLQAIMPQEPNWDELFKSDPQGARQLQKQYDEVRQKIQHLQGNRHKAAQEAAYEEQRQMAAYAEEEFSKFVSVNGFRSEQELAAEVNEMRKTALAHGFTPDEISQVLDSRMLNVLRKASRYDRLMAKRPKPTNQKSPKPITPGAGKKATAPKGSERAMRNLSRTGTVEAAAGVFANIIKGR